MRPSPADTSSARSAAQIAGSSNNERDPGESPYRTSSPQRVLSLVAITVCLLLAVSLGPVVVARSTQGAADPIVDKIIGQVDQESLIDYVADLSGERPVIIEGEETILETRHSSSPGIDRALAYIRQHHEGLDLATAYHDYLNEDRTWYNLEAILPGYTHPERIVIICAHADSTSSTLPFVDAPGADDNATGVATVLMAADILSNYQFENTIRFISFSGEEQGLQGSAAYAARAAALGEEIVAVVNLDMLGWDELGAPDMDLHAGTDPASLALAHVFSETVSTYDIQLVPQIVGSGATRASDHSPFWNHDYPAVLVIEDYVPSQPDFNPYYHSGYDLLQYINPTYFTAMTQASIGTVATLAVPWSPSTPTASPSPSATFSATPTPTPTCTPTVTATSTATPTSVTAHSTWLPLTLSDRRVP